MQIMGSGIAGLGKIVARATFPNYDEGGDCDARVVLDPIPLVHKMAAAHGSG